MSEDGKNILAGIKQIRGLFEQTALLLRTIDDQLKKIDWNNLNNTVTAFTSQSIHNPKQWFPEFLFRFYINEKKKNILLFSSILLDDDCYGEYKTKMIEPVISAGFFDYGQGEEFGTAYDYGMPEWYGYYGDLTIAGTIYSGKEWEESPDKDDYKFKSYGCFALPLVEIRNSDDISNKIISPLMHMININK